MMTPLTRMLPWATLFAAATIMESVVPLAAGERDPAIVSTERIYDSAPFPSCHASTIVETDGRLVAAWFGGTDEGESDVGIWLSIRQDDGWSAPAAVADGIQADGQRFPCWNPVLFTDGRGWFWLCYKVGPSPSQWWGAAKSSRDGGRTWSEATKLPSGILGPIKNKPLLLEDGELLCGASTEHDGWKVHVERTDRPEGDWSLLARVAGPEFDAIQPTFLKHADGRLQMLCRTKQGRVAASFSRDRGATWSELAATSLPNPNSGLDAVTLSDGRHLLVYNHTTNVAGKWGGPRSPLNIAVSSDGLAWQAALVLESESGEFSYPAVIQAQDGLVHVTYTHQRKHIMHCVVDPQKLRPRGFIDGAWPK